MKKSRFANILISYNSAGRVVAKETFLDGTWHECAFPRDYRPSLQDIIDAMEVPLQGINRPRADGAP